MGHSRVFSQLLIPALGLLAVIAIVLLAPRIPKATNPRDPAFSRGRRGFLLATIAASLLFCVLAAALEAGYANSMRALRDTEGHGLGHGAPLTPELARMVLSNATAGSMIDALGWYGVLFLALHQLALAYLVGALRTSSGFAARFCWMQFVLFPLGWLTSGMLLELIVYREIVGEDLTDFPFWWTSQSLWLLAAALAGWWLQRASHAPAIGAPHPVREPSPS